MSAYFRPIILNAFPRNTWGPIVQSTIKGVALADRLLRQEQWLDWAVGKDQRGDLRRVGVMWSVRDACAKEVLPFGCRDCDNTVGNCHHVKIRSQNVRLHITKTDTVLAMPRDTRLRNDERAANQLELFEPPTLTTDLEDIKTWYGWLTFNADLAGRLTHVALGLPEHDRNEWLDILPIPLGESGAFTSEGDEPPPPGPEQLLRFNEYIQKMLEPSCEDGEYQEGGADN